MKKNSAWLKPWKIMLIVLASFAGSFIAKWSFLYFCTHVITLIRP